MIHDHDLYLLFQPHQLTKRLFSPSQLRTTLERLRMMRRRMMRMGMGSQRTLLTPPNPLNMEM
jgi:hypothetical protein